MVSALRAKYAGRHLNDSTRTIPMNNCEVPESFSINQHCNYCLRISAYRVYDDDRTSCHGTSENSN